MGNVKAKDIAAVRYTNGRMDIWKLREEVMMGRMMCDG